MTRVIVVGGGVGGLTVAHELAERGFEVHVYDAREAWGGKARSQPVAGTGTHGRRDLPGEHGFRFYPRFYRHVIDTMARTPIPGAAGRTVDSRLRPCAEAAVAMVDDDTLSRFRRRSVARPYELLEALQLFFQDFAFDTPDVGMFGLKLMQFATSCDERRLGQYEQMSWWDYLEGERYSDRFRSLLKAGPRLLVAMDSKQGNARVNGTITIQLVLDFASGGADNDRTMGGPTTEMWIDPWTAHLRSLGVQFHPGETCTGLGVADGRIAGARFASGAVATGDHYVLAVPIEAAHALMSADLAALDPQCERLRTADVDRLVSWMVGMQFYLYEDVPLVRGHVAFPNSRWSLTAISQPQFWRETVGLFRRHYGDGEVGGLLSVDISDWGTEGMFVGKTARECTPDEIKTEVWGQLKAALNGRGPDQQLLTDDLLHSWHLDSDLDYSNGVPPRNSSRLLIHPPGAWALRPEAASAVPNLCFASDYVRTHTDLASMEGACEAGRRAANAILDRAASTASRAGVWPLEEPREFDEWKRLDARLYAEGKPHCFEAAGLRRAFDAADLFRRFTASTGIARLEDFLGEFKLTHVVDGLLSRLGIGK
ncbi:MAG TPA: FAD-dependent oxidoreductase [Candidatus Eisenbacteria bacterium]|nr:FAD-dependent oxidoreductase [Candidatus Eisenbacteria bacterium]